MTPQEWVAAILDRARTLGTIPRYGDADWQRLAPSDPRAVAAVAVAAECWRTESDPVLIADRLRLELAADELAAVRAVAEDRAELVRALTSRPPVEELRRRRGGGPRILAPVDSTRGVT